MVGNKLKIFYVFKGSIYDNSAPVNRIIGISKELYKLNIDISIHNVLPVLKNKITKNSNIVPIINYSYSTNSFVLNKIMIIYNLIKIAYYIIKQKPTHIIQYGDNLLLTFFLHLLKINKSFTHILEQNEYPYKVLKESVVYKLIGQKYLKLNYYWFDRIFVISQVLKEYFGKYTSSNCIITVIPMTVDIERFTNIETIQMPFKKNIVYCGSLSQKKDGIESLIHAMKKLEELYIDTGLVIIGGGNTKEENNLKKLIRRLYLEKKIKLIGKIDRDEVPNYLSSSTVLVLPRPSSLQAEGGFPTKLGEYLLSGKPVICTSVGEIPKFLINNKDAYIIEPDSIDEITNTVIKVLNNYQEAINIGLQGKKTGKKMFNAQTQAKIIKSTVLKDVF